MSGSSQTYLFNSNFNIDPSIMVIRHLKKYAFLLLTSICITHAISLAVNYRLFSHGDVSYRFNGENDNVVLELNLIGDFYSYLHVNFAVCLFT